MTREASRKEKKRKEKVRSTGEKHKQKNTDEIITLFNDSLHVLPCVVSLFSNEPLLYLFFILTSKRENSSRQFENNSIFIHAKTHFSNNN